jgi:hypothetical protein
MTTQMDERPMDDPRESRENSMRWQNQDVLFDERRRRWRTISAVGWIAILAALTAIVMGAALAFAR